MSFSLVSPSFQQEAFIPREYTVDGEDRSPNLVWEGEPAGTQSFALIVDDPDAPAGDWVHWVVYNIPKTWHELKEGYSEPAFGAEGVVQGINDFGSIGYMGPSPPPGKPHRYFFKLYALDDVLVISDGVNKNALEKAMKGHVLGKAELVGQYQRR